MLLKSVVVITAIATSMNFSSGALAGNLGQELDAAHEIEALQPPKELIALIEEQPSQTSSDVRLVSSFTASELPYRPNAALMKNGLPFYPYYALREGSNHVLHPMALGRFLLWNAKGSLAGETVDAALKVAHTLPNGGLAWYYPRHYQVARMLGANLKYSSISQGTIIAGLTGMAEAGSADPQLAAKAFEAMLWPFEKGGVNLAGRAVLEMPSFAGPPEIILNGWIDALIHMRDYGEISGNQKALDFFKTNVAFLADILPNFDARDVTISRYSDLSPYRVKARLARPQDVDTLQVLYRPKIEGLPAIKVPLKLKEENEEISSYENHIARQNGREAIVWLSCSQMYDTVLVSRSPEMTVETSRGRYDRRATIPGNAGEPLTMPSSSSGDLRFVSLGAQNGLICGFPTNFSKGGTHNYYHVYHIVGLMLVALSDEVDADDRKTLLTWALKWKDDMERIQKSEDLEFRSLHDMLGDINANQAKIAYSDFDKLLSDVNAALEERP